MIDWVTCSLPCHHQPIQSGMVMKVSPDGDLDWSVRCRLSVPGSYESSVTVSSDGGDGEGMATQLRFSGNPSKFLQGHNVFGSNDIKSLMFDTYLKLLRHLEITPTMNDLNAVKEGAYELTLVDINQSFELGNRADVMAWIRAGEYKSKTRHGRPSMKGGTIYWGKSSARWALKAYSKGEELEASKHGLPDALQATPIQNWADNKLRIELRLKKKELRDNGIYTVSDLTTGRTEDLYGTYVRKLEMTEQIALSDEQTYDLPTRLISTYTLWKSGHDLRNMLPKATYYRHRKELLEYGIDIALSKESVDRTNVVPMIRILEAQPASIPDWAFEQHLVHHSAAV